MSQETLVTPGSIVSWKVDGTTYLGKVKTIDRVFREGDITCMSLSVQYDERYCKTFPMGIHETYVTYPTHCDVVFI